MDQQLKRQIDCLADRFASGHIIGANDTFFVTQYVQAFHVAQLMQTSCVVSNPCAVC